MVGSPGDPGLAWPLRERFSSKPFECSAIPGPDLAPGTYREAEPKYVRDHLGLGGPVHPSELGVPSFLWCRNVRQRLRRPGF